jgi:hypothetical protein
MMILHVKGHFQSESRIKARKKQILSRSSETVWGACNSVGQTQVISVCTYCIEVQVEHMPIPRDRENEPLSLAFRRLQRGSPENLVCTVGKAFNSKQKRSSYCKIDVREKVHPKVLVLKDSRLHSRNENVKFMS